ncbi:PREDICTED: serine/threonine-protein phosphatase 4 regulatory subunit 1-like isoform X3 [Habropoda laboriosa]|uniref:serine/threonine-protein phosphatase 4 regulatory subunit 1-like isoform X3 n=1 Tax=Habropoda laboriosa TaxID=597456 RepID=UPI00083E5B32|nr:PREDICTED: serine/threonine-protein phosphatase 4 regulatory subunit 1-like isoform X3 [Habropoda laboriosa]
MAHTGSKHATTDILPFVRGNVNLRKGRKKVSNKCHRRSNLLYNNDAALITKNKTARITPRIGRILVEGFHTVANNGTKLDANEIMQSVLQIVDDPDTQVRVDLMEQLPHLATICHEAPHLFGDALHDHLLGIIIKYLQDQDNLIRMTTQATVLTLTKKGLLDNHTIEIKLCPIIDTLCSSVDYIHFGISLMNKLAPLIGKELTEKIFLDKYIALCKDTEFYVKKICVSHFGELCAAVGRKALFRKLFPIFVDLCCNKVWGIRKACVEVMVPVSCCMTLQHRQLLLAELLETHLNDDSKWVRMSAFQILGPFISTFAKEFTEVTYQRGELVFTSQQDPRFSIRYSYEGIFPTKGVIQNLILEPEDHNSKDNFNSSVIIQKPIYEEDDDKDESQKDIFRMRAYMTKHSKNENQTTDDTEKYNPFLYYYIAPDLPPDDELVEAAKKSAAQNNVDWKPMTDTTASSKASSLDDILKEEEYSANEPEMIIVNGQKIVPLHLVNSFLFMAEPECSDMGTDILHHCAFSFPAVVLTLGKENWPYLQSAYQSLASANQWKVRRTLAYSIHELATILGQELTTTDLVPIYDGFIKDLDEVRIGVLKHLSTFLKILKPVDRRQYLPRLKEFLATDNESNWRFREDLATQLLEIVNLFGPVDVERHIVPLSLKLLRDKVAAVRHVALSLVTQIVAHLSDNERLVAALFQELKYSLAVNGTKWIRRQTFALICAKLISSNAISGDRFSQEMLPNLLKLSSDKVPNVRLAVARTLSKNVVSMGPEWLGVEQAEEVERRLKEMRSDPDRDVRLLAGGEENPVLDILSQTKTEQSRNILF